MERIHWFRLVSLFMLLIISVYPASSQTLADAYADAVGAGSTPLIVAPASALGSPDGQSAVVVSVLGQGLVLDMGAGEEGTGDLIVHYRGVNVAVTAQVDFLAADQTVLHTAAIPLVGLNADLGYELQVAYPRAPQPWRFVRFRAAATVYLIDAAQATTYRPDTDGDGLPDDQEGPIGTDPQDADTDDDGMPDGWEVDHGLDPRNPNDAASDPDGDGLPNRDEYTYRTNPRRADTDGDTLPDGWEVRYQFDPNDPTGEHGAAGDPDGDRIPNGREHAHGSNPRVANPSLILPMIFGEW
ncbi:MAG TPA: hypothetical protein VGE07_02110 [Herpetosiphonaceae bacterium]